MPEDIMGFGAPGFEGEGLLELLDGLWEVSFFHQEITEVVVGFGEFWGDG